MKTKVTVVTALFLLVLAMYVLYAVQRNALLNYIRVQVGVCLMTTYDEYLKAGKSAQIEPSEFMKALLASPTYASMPGTNNLHVAAGNGPVAIGSERLICVVTYQDKVFVGIRGNRQTKMLTKDEFRTWNEHPVRSR